MMSSLTVGFNVSILTVINSFVRLFWLKQRHYDQNCLEDKQHKREENRRKEFLFYAAYTPSKGNIKAPADFLNKLDVPGLPLFELHLKKNFPVTAI